MTAASTKASARRAAAHTSTPSEPTTKDATDDPHQPPHRDAPVRVLIACEESGTVRDAFANRGHDAWSCDLLPSRTPGQHIQGDAVQAALGQDWDLMVAFPPCTHMASSGARWFKQKKREQEMAMGFFLALAWVPIERIAVENPVGIMSTWFRKPDQIIQPWQFGHGETKATCLWLKNLPKLTPTNIVDGREQRIWKMGPSATRSRDRSVTYQGIADAMADQWGSL